MNQIHLLPENLSNQIAAGEVVERPASVVKELVENSLDAGATRVFVMVDDGGRKRIRVVDNGSGMNRQDATLCVRRHATSKVKRSEDLQAIGTLGFRGEALPSIASVSRFHLATRTSQEAVGTQITIEGGVAAEARDAGCGVGTTIDVQDLFFNVPARLKFLKSRGTEMNHIRQLMTAFALGNASVHFRLTHNGRKVMDYPPEQTLKARIFKVLGAKACDRLFETYLDADITLSGFVSDPGYTRAGTQGVYTFVNGRHVRDKLILRALSTGYGGELERGRYPHAVLYLTVNPETVDVNVHPTKHEVRFVQGGRVFECVTRALKMTLSAAPWLDAPQASLESTPQSATPQPLWKEEPGPTPTPRIWNSPPPPRTSSVVQEPGFEFRTQDSSGNLGQGILLVKSAEELTFLRGDKARALLGLQSLQEASEVQSQPLLFPEQLPAPRALVEKVETQPDLLPGTGFLVEPFGETTLVLKGIPSLLSGTGVHRTTLEKILDTWGGGRAPAREQILQTIARALVDIPLEPAEESEVRRAFEQGKLPDTDPLFGKLVHRVSMQEVHQWLK